jgi:hypothetical protein
MENARDDAVHESVGRAPVAIARRVEERLGKLLAAFLHDLRRPVEG